MLYTLYIHEDEKPPSRREVVPGEYVANHMSRHAPVMDFYHMLWNRTFDFVATVGFDFADLPAPVQEEVRQHMHAASSVMRLNRA